MSPSATNHISNISEHFQAVCFVSRKACFDLSHPLRADMAGANGPNKEVIALCYVKACSHLYINTVGLQSRNSHFLRPLISIEAVFVSNFCR
jgi:hypothetical protein